MAGSTTNISIRMDSDLKARADFIILLYELMDTLGYNIESDWSKSNR